MTYKSSSIPGLLSSFLQSINDDFSDVTLECEGRMFPSHKIILVYHSKFFSSLFSDMFCEDSSSPFVFHLPGVTKAGLEQVINCLYSRPTQITTNNVWKVVKDADFLLMDEVKDDCSTFLLSILNLNNCLGIWAMADQFHMDRLSFNVKQFVMINMREMGDIDEFLAMDYSTLVGVLQDDQLVVKEEADVWRLVLGWIKGNKDKIEQTEMLVRAIRFGLIDRFFFIYNIASHPSISSMPIIKEAGQYLAVLNNPNTSLSQMLMDKYQSSTPKFALPRLPAQFLLQLGGCTFRPVSSLLVYDIQADRWSRLELQLPDCLVFPAAECVGDKVVLIGGVSHDIPQPLTYSRKTWIVCLNRLVVERLPDMKTSRDIHDVSTALVGDTVYAVGGRRSGEGHRRLTSCEKLQLSHVGTQQPLNWERINPLATGRSYAAAVGVGDKVWVVGGFDGESSLSSVEVLDTGSGRWRKGPDLMAARSRLGCAYLGGWIYAAGGIDGSSHLRSVERIKPGGRKWERVVDMINPKSNFTLTALEGRLVAVGGFTGVVVSAKVEMFDPEFEVWTLVESLPEGMAGMTSVMVDREKLSWESQELFRYDKRDRLMEENIDRKMKEIEKMRCDHMFDDVLSVSSSSDADGA